MRLPGELEQFDWSVTTWEGSRREQMRRWAALPLERIILAIEEMDALSRALHAPDSAAHPQRRSVTLPPD